MEHNGHRRRPVPMPDAHAMAMQLAIGRTAFAAAMMAAPQFSVRLLGADAATARRISWLARMTAVRDGALGVGALAATRNGGAGAAAWLLGGAVSDAVDTLVVGAALRQGRAKGIGAIAVVPFAALAAAAGAVTAARLRRA